MNYVKRRNHLLVNEAWRIIDDMDNLREGLKELTAHLERLEAIEIKHEEVIEQNEKLREENKYLKAELNKILPFKKAIETRDRTIEELNEVIEGLKKPKLPPAPPPRNHPTYPLLFQS